MTHRHKITGRLLTIKKDLGHVLICEGEPRNIPGTIRTESCTYICQKDNVEQLKTEG